MQHIYRLVKTRAAIHPLRSKVEMYKRIFNYLECKITTPKFLNLTFLQLRTQRFSYNFGILARPNRNNIFDQIYIEFRTLAHQQISPQILYKFKSHQCKVTAIISIKANNPSIKQENKLRGKRNITKSPLQYTSKAPELCRKD